ncbi:MAG: glutamate formimidoyltransferase [Acidobacteriota bacterium]
MECIPNVSEGRSSAVIDSLAEPLDVSGRAALLHVHPDVDHNRTVFTVVGDPETLLPALEEFYARAIELIDMRSHRGVHPRIGVVDVCPFVPLPEHGSSMEDCIELSRGLGQRLAERFDLPVFLYREAATQPARRDLTAIRRGQFEGLKAKLALPEWQPDFGPCRPHRSAGATVIGARGPLVACNVVLDCDDLAVAKEIAARVRASSGGLPGIKAMGVRLASRRLVQVSMNVEDPQASPLHVAVDQIRAAACRRGVTVLETELVGIAPLEVIMDAAGAYLQINELGAGQVLENAILARF